MPLSTHIAQTITSLEFNLIAFGEGDWGPEVRARLIDESVALLDEILLDPVFCFTLQLAQEAKTSPEKSFKAYVAGSAPLLSFLDKEKVLLAGSNLPNETIDRIIQETRRTIESGLGGLTSAEDVFQSIVRVKFALLAARENQKPSKWRKVARALSSTFGGAALVTLNATGWAASMGITGPLSALSAAAGGSLLGEGAKDFLGLMP